MQWIRLAMAIGMFSAIMEKETKEVFRGNAPNLVKKKHLEMIMSMDAKERKHVESFLK